jgi:hypothetical protein
MEIRSSPFFSSEPATLMSLSVGKLNVKESLKEWNPITGLPHQVLVQFEDLLRKV